jgi:hypothetical protein
MPFDLASQHCAIGPSRQCPTLRRTPPLPATSHVSDPSPFLLTPCGAVLPRPLLLPPPFKQSQSRPRAPCPYAISSPTPGPKCSSVGPSRCLGHRSALSRTPLPLVDHLALLSPHQCSSILASCITPPCPPPFQSMSCSRVRLSFTSVGPTLSPSSTATTFSTAPDAGGHSPELQPSHHCRARVLTAEACHCCSTVPGPHHRRLPELP